MKFYSRKVEMNQHIGQSLHLFGYSLVKK